MRIGMDDVALKLRRNISSIRMAEDVKTLVSFGPRHAGTSKEHKAAEYIKTEFQKMNINVRVDRVENIISWEQNDCRVKVVEPVEQELTSIALLGSGSTPPDGLVAELLYVGAGKMVDYLNADVRNKIIMRDPPRALMLDNASDEVAPQGPTKMLLERGAVGFLEHSRLPGKILQMPLLSGPEGLLVPAVAVTYEDGQFIKELLREWYAIPRGFKRRTEQLPVMLRVWVNTEIKPSYGINVIARIEGYGKEDEVICLVAHHDNANGPGACDNATAVGVNLEAARVLSRMPQPKRSIEFLSLTAEEYGEIGSFAYVNKYIKNDPSKYKGCINLDIIGNGDHLYYIEESICMGKLVRNDPNLNKDLVEVCNSLGYYIEGTPLEYAGDDGPFIMAGVPTSYLAKLISPSWPYLHTYM
ncbi:MAG: M20/M25/M40 family metallo-hydrolase, partial [Bacteroidia bacterium]|nr:M20/M25/M40 family metallo-hydrolase [Bacteroidia bacterium]